MTFAYQSTSYLVYAMLVSRNRLASSELPESGLNGWTLALNSPLYVKKN